MDELLSDPAYGRGERPFPRPVSADEAADVAEMLLGQIEVGAAERQRTAAAGGTPLACSAGCASCCEQMVMVTLPEQLLVTRWLEHASNRDVADAFLDGYPAWRQRAGDAPEALAERTARGDRAGHLRLMTEHWERRRLPCAFLRDGMCSIYPVRPLVCRTAHAVGSPDPCTPGHPKLPVRFRLPRFDEFVDKAHALLRATHHAAGGPLRRPRSLCVGVHERLTGQIEEQAPARVGRNAPCPCGSGKKHKRCCGR